MVVTGYYDTPEAWAEGADPAYESLSRAIVGASPVRLAGRMIADLGAGTGATSRAIVAAGGRPLALDSVLPMLDHARARRPPAVAADMAALPICDGGVGGAVAAFSLSHVADPVSVLREAARVTTPGGPILAGVFATTGVRHEVAAIVDSLATERGRVAPAWYLHLKAHLEPQVASDEVLARLATSAGLVAVRVTVRHVSAGLDTSEALVRWRLSGPAMAPFVRSLSESELTTMCEDAQRALGPCVQPLRPAVRILSSVAPATR